MTPERRAELRRVARDVRLFPGAKARSVPVDEAISDLLDALEAAEAERDEWRIEARRLHVEESRASGALSDCANVPTDPLADGIEALRAERDAARDALREIATVLNRPLLTSPPQHAHDCEACGARRNEPLCYPAVEYRVE